MWLRIRLHACVRSGNCFEAENDIAVEFVETSGFIGKGAGCSEQGGAVGAAGAQQRIDGAAESEGIVAMQFSQIQDIAVYLLELFLGQ